MALKRISAETLLELAATTLRRDVAADLPPDKRYTLAMVANALDIARREIASDSSEPLWELLDGIYESGEGSPRQLATDIRSGRVSELRNPGLGIRLKALLEAELAVRNPRRLKTPAAT